MTRKILSGWRRNIPLLVALGMAVVAGFVLGPAKSGQVAPAFKVLAFYSGTYDAAHIDFEKEARPWFANAGLQYGFAFEATTNWYRLNDAADMAQYKVLMFLDDQPPAGARAALSLQRWRLPSDVARLQTSTVGDTRIVMRCLTGSSPHSNDINAEDGVASGECLMDGWPCLANVMRSSALGWFNGLLWVLIWIRGSSAVSGAGHK